MYRHRPLLSVALVCLSFLSPSLAQDRPISQQFRFLSDVSGLGTSLPTCQPLAIQVESQLSAGVPPYYMIAYEIDGTPRRSLIGTEDGALSYTVTHPPGKCSKLVLNVVDSTASGGGIPPITFDVVAGSSVDCVVSSPAQPDFVVWTNVTGRLQNCEPLGIAIDGGVPPYNITIASLDAPTVTNDTLTAQFDAYIWINRAPPGAQLAVSASDSTGRWATGTFLIATEGVGEPVCPGLLTSQGDWVSLGFVKPEQAETPQQDDGRPAPGGDKADAESGNKPSEAEQKEGGKNNTALIAGITVPVVVVLLGAIGFAIWFFRRRKNRETGQDSETEKVHFNKNPSSPLGGPPSITPFDVGGPFSVSSVPSTIMSKKQEAENRYPGPASATSVGSSIVPPTFTAPIASAPRGPTSDTSSMRPSATAPASAASGPANSVYSKASEAMSASSSGAGPSGAPGEEIIIQHTDSGLPSIRELPPPYPTQT
ncbi:hypothetical protein FA15DRAFT_644365 [Coprinopsis marcescibilis]|uniref:Uncharacterized protein n=1 Tax=Coprinopsis marcescibilis TaxID=230819 RepID=A0A5C3KPR9_COPMA|nr:hypothetical protein FA15DRAFT_644365 [Coprinopsis marcescibilis]